MSSNANTLVALRSTLPFLHFLTGISLPVIKILRGKNARE